MKNSPINSTTVVGIADATGLILQHLFDGNYAFLRARISSEIELRLLTLNSL